MKLGKKSEFQMAFEPKSPLDLASAPTPELRAGDSMMGKV